MMKSLRPSVSLVVLAACLAVSSAAAADAAPSAARLDKKHCAICHAKDGSGDTKQGRKTETVDWRDGSIWTRVDDATAKQVILEGKGKMKGYAAKLPAERVDAVLAFCKGLSKPPAGAEAPKEEAPKEEAAKPAPPAEKAPPAAPAD